MDFKDFWKAGLYIRISREDGDTEESYSVTNQRELLQHFVLEEQNMTIIDYYIDDGFSGTNFNRPAFMKMLEDIKAKKVNTVIVKDLSRFGRSFLEVGNYLENIFPLFDVRFISVNDEIDSYKKEMSLFSINVPLKNLLNDQYCQDISKKVKTAKMTMRKSGKYVSGGFAPYGYMRDPNDKNHLVIDPDVKENVELIFKMYLDGNTTSDIAKKLKSMKIITPLNYHRKKKLGETIYNEEKLSYWQSSCIGEMLKSRVYCGDTVQNKASTKSYKDKSIIYYDEKDWIIVEGTHEAYISRESHKEIIEKMASRLKGGNRKKSKKTTPFYKYTKKLYCSDCGRLLRRQVNYKKPFYQCSSYIEYGNESCSSHRIYEKDVDDIVRKSINANIKLLMRVEKIIDYMNIEKSSTPVILRLNKEIEKIKKSMQIKSTQKSNIYEQWKLGKITRDEYIKWCEEYEKSIIRDNEKINELCVQIGKADYKEYDTTWIEKFTHLEDIEISKELLDLFIDKITIYESENVVIKFKFEDELNKALDIIKADKDYQLGGVL